MTITAATRYEPDTLQALNVVRLAQGRPCIEPYPIKARYGGNGEGTAEPEEDPTLFYTAGQWVKVRVGLRMFQALYWGASNSRVKFDSAGRRINGVKRAWVVVFHHDAGGITYSQHKQATHKTECFPMIVDVERIEVRRPRGWNKLTPPPPPAWF